MRHPETKEWPLGVVLSLASGRLLCAFSDMHAFAEWLVGSSVYTHQFAHRLFVEEMRRAIFAQHPALRAFDEDSVTKENWCDKLTEAEQHFGRTLTLRPMGEPEHAGASFTEPLAGKSILVVETREEPTNGVQPTLTGVATQLDNYIAGLLKRVESAEAAHAALRARLKKLVDKWRDPEYWNTDGARMDSVDCADDLLAALREEQETTT